MRVGIGPRRGCFGEGEILEEEFRCIIGAFARKLNCEPTCFQGHRAGTSSHYERAHNRPLVDEALVLPYWASHMPFRVYTNILELLDILTDTALPETLYNVFKLRLHIECV